MEGEKGVANNQVQKEEKIRGKASWEIPPALTNKISLHVNEASRTAKNTRSKTRLRTLRVYSISNKRAAVKWYADDNMIRVAIISGTHIQECGYEGVTSSGFS